LFPWTSIAIGTLVLVFILLQNIMVALGRKSARKTTGGHLKDFADGLTTRGVTGKHAGMKLAQAARIIDLTGAQRIAELTPSRVQTALKTLRDGDGPGAPGGLSAQTCLHYLRSVKQLSAVAGRQAGGRVGLPAARQDLGDAAGGLGERARGSTSTARRREGQDDRHLWRTRLERSARSACAARIGNFLQHWAT
jgi:hypothetical protein